MTPAEQQQLADIVANAVKNALLGATGLSANQAADIALAAGKTAVQENNIRMFAMLGVNMSDAKDMARFAADIQFLKSLHDNAGIIGWRVVVFLLIAFLGGIVLAIGAGLKVLLGGGAPH